MENQKTKIVLNAPSGATMTLSSYDEVNLESDMKNKLTNFSIKANVFDETEIKTFGIGSEVLIYSCKESENFDDFLIFKGIVEQNPKQLDMIEKSYEFKGKNKLAITQRIIVNESYENWKISDIVNDLITNYKENDFNIGYIQPVDYTITIKFKDEFLYTALERLSEAIGFTFDIDLNDNFNFVESATKINNKIIKMGDYKRGSAKFSYDASRLVNKLTVYGGKTLSSDITQTIKGDGANSTYLLNYKPRASSTGNIIVTLNGSAQSVGIQGLSESNVDCIINYNEKNIKFVNIADGSEKVLNVTDNVSVTYRYESSLITKIEDKASIETYGRKEDIIKFLDVTDKIALLDRARAHLRKYANPVLSGSLSTWLNDWEAGERVKIEIEIDEGYFVNDWLQITSKKLSLLPNDIKVSYNFEQERQLHDILKNLKERIESLEKNDENETVQQLDTIGESVAIGELNYITTSRSGGFLIGSSKIGGYISG